MNLTGKQEEYLFLLLANKIKIYILLNSFIVWKKEKVKLNKTEEKPINYLIEQNILTFQSKQVVLNYEHPVVKKYNNRYVRQLLSINVTYKKMTAVELIKYGQDKDLFEKSRSGYYKLNNLQYITQDYLQMLTLPNLGENIFICLFKNNFLIGVLDLSFYMNGQGLLIDENKKPLYCLNSLSIHPNYRQQGYSKLLISLANNFIPKNTIVFSTNLSDSGKQAKVVQNMNRLIMSEFFDTIDKIPKDKNITIRNRRYRR